MADPSELQATVLELPPGGTAYDPLAVSAVGPPGVGDGAEEAPGVEAPGGNGNKRSAEQAHGDEPDTKRTNNGAPAASAFPAAPAFGEMPTSSELSETMVMPNARVGKLIGRGGSNIQYVQSTGQCHVKIDQNTTAETRIVTIIGSAANIVRTKKLINDLLDAPEPGGPMGGGGGGGPAMGGGGGFGAPAPAASGPPGAAGSAKRELACPLHIVGKIIGRGGETIRSLQTASSAHILIDQNVPEGQPRRVEVTGSEDAVNRAYNMIMEIIQTDGSATTSAVITKYGAGMTRMLESPKHMIGRVIGRGGETVKQLQKHFNVNVQIEQNANPCTVTISGQHAPVEAAMVAISDLIEGRPSPFGGTGPPGAGGPPAPGGFGAGGYGAPGGAYGAPAMGGFGGGAYGAPGGAYGGYGAPAPAYGQQPAAYGGYPGYDPAAHGAYGAGAPAAAYGQQPHAYGQQAYGQAPPPAAAAGGWQELRDDQSRVYYFNAATGVSQWERPASM
ncbi:hypothetical protein FOA52_015785 [Chlamydomonas sp. UWO 241]|nr:hypothetical protein FOA52_015785 [Chlamydomonas sp. UWO 241]